VTRLRFHPILPPEVVLRLRDVVEWAEWVALSALRAGLLFQRFSTTRTIRCFLPLPAFDGVTPVVFTLAQVASLSLAVSIPKRCLPDFLSISPFLTLELSWPWSTSFCGVYEIVWFELRGSSRAFFGFPLPQTIMTPVLGVLNFSRSLSRATDSRPHVREFPLRRVAKVHPLTP